MWRILATALIVFCVVSCAEPLKKKLSKQPEWLPFAIEGEVLARTWVPAHEEVSQDHDGKLSTTQVPEQFFLLVVTRLGSFRLSIGAGGYSWAYEGRVVLVVGVVSNEEHPKLVVAGIKTLKKPHENYKAAAS